MIEEASLDYSFYFFLSGSYIIKSRKRRKQNYFVPLRFVHSLLHSILLHFLYFPCVIILLALLVHTKQPVLLLWPLQNKEITLSCPNLPILCSTLLLARSLCLGSNSWLHNPSIHKTPFALCALHSSLTQLHTTLHVTYHYS